MADFASSDVTVTINRQNILRGSPGGLRFNQVKITFGDAALTYNTGGVPMPAAAKFGMLQRLDNLLIVSHGVLAVSYIWNYDSVNNKMIGVEEVAATESTALKEIADATAIAAQTIYAIAIGW